MKQPSKFLILKKSFFGLICVILRAIVPLMRVQSCSNHIKSNVETRFGVEASNAFSSAAQEATESEFYSKLGKLANGLDFNFFPFYYYLFIA